MAQPTITVFSKNPCGQCDMTKSVLNKAEVPYQTHDVQKDAEAYEKVKKLGYLSAPVVIHTDQNGNIDHWYGFNPDKLKGAIANLKHNL